MSFPYGKMGPKEQKGCCTTKTGVNLIGWFQIMCSIFGIIFVGYCLIFSIGDYDATSTESSTMIAALSITLLLVIINLMFSALLVVGNMKENLSYLQAYQVFAGICVLMGFIGGVMNFLNGQPGASGALLSIGLTICFILVVRCRVYEISQANEIKGKLTAA